VTRRLLEGSEALAEAAIAAGCRFFAGYPITPSSEIAERMARELPKAGGVFIQMEDEIASIAAVLGASMGGVKAMTATSGPGFSLKQENLGYAAAAEIPCVIVNVMRGGPSTGMPTRPAQGDLMQARWGSHGDYPVVVLTPASVREVYEQTQRAFAIAETCRVPVILLYDQAVAQLMETVELPAQAAAPTERNWASGAPGERQPYAAGADGVPAMPRPGDGIRAHTTGLTHDESGFPTQKPADVQRNVERLLGKLGHHRGLIESWQAVDCEDADVLVVALGITARAAQRAVAACREQGVRAGLFRPLTLWPFPEEALRVLAHQARSVLVPELNAGQLRLEVERVLGREVPVAGMNRVDGNPLEPDAIVTRILSLAYPRIAARAEAAPVRRLATPASGGGSA
jgi:2-oxoglutarate ferredoxin oxidoreductase subunit alpha